MIAAYNKFNMYIYIEERDSRIHLCFEYATATQTVVIGQYCTHARIMNQSNRADSILLYHTVYCQRSSGM